MPAQDRQQNLSSCDLLFTKLFMLDILPLPWTFLYHIVYEYFYHPLHGLFIALDFISTTFDLTLF